VRNMVIKKGPDVSLALFGGVLDYDGAGYYPGLELLNFVYCTADSNLLPNSETVEIKRRSHDFGRRLVWDENFKNNSKRHNVLLDDNLAEETLRELLRCLQIKIPNGSEDPSWYHGHFFPYTPSLIHWDARERKKNEEEKRILIERIYLRGGGALAYKILRSDADLERLQRLRDGFKNLYAEAANGPLEILAKFLNEQSATDTKPSEDIIERNSISNIDDFENTYR
jgi:hypothetical protein